MHPKAAGTMVGAKQLRLRINAYLFWMLCFTVSETLMQ
jgi:hypothetical protein